MFCLGYCILNEKFVIKFNDQKARNLYYPGCKKKRGTWMNILKHTKLKGKQVVNKWACTLIRVQTMSVCIDYACVCVCVWGWCYRLKI